MQLIEGLCFVLQLSLMMYIHCRSKICGSMASDDMVHVARSVQPFRTEQSHGCVHTMDKGIGLFDKLVSELEKTILQMLSNCDEWNSMEPMNLVVGLKISMLIHTT